MKTNKQSRNYHINANDIWYALCYFFTHLYYFLFQFSLNSIYLHLSYLFFFLFMNMGGIKVVLSCQMSTDIISNNISYIIDINILAGNKS